MQTNLIKFIGALAKRHKNKRNILMGRREVLYWEGKEDNGEYDQSAHIQTHNDIVSTWNDVCGIHWFESGLTCILL